MATELTILADHREASSGVPALLSRCDEVEVFSASLRSADYSIAGVLGIERKTAVDFAKSIIDGRLFAQAAALRRSYRRPLLIVERLHSSEGSCCQRIPENIAGVSYPALRGALLSLSAVFGVPVLHSSGPRETAELIVNAARQIARTADDGYVRPGYRPKGWRKRALYILQGLPKVGPARAAALLSAFGSVAAAFAADQNTLARVPGIGPRIARGFRRAVGEPAGTTFELAPTRKRPLGAMAKR